MKPISKYQGLVLKTKDYKENASLVTIITKDFKQNYVVKGTKKINSKTAKWINFFNYISFNATDTPNLNTLTEAYVINYFPNINIDQDKLEVAFIISEKLDLFFEQVNDTNKLFEFTLKILELLEKTNYPKQVLQLFEIKIMYLLGISPVLNQCVKCGNMNDHNNDDNKFFFSVLLGGVICKKCMIYDEFNSNNFILNNELTKVFKYLYYIKIENIDEEFLKLIFEIEKISGEKELNKTIDLYYQEYLDFTSKVKKVYLAMRGEQ